MSNKKTVTTAQGAKSNALKYCLEHVNDSTQKVIDLIEKRASKGHFFCKSIYNKSINVEYLIELGFKVNHESEEKNFLVVSWYSYE